MHRLPTRCINEIWEVRVPFRKGDTWVQCRSMRDCHTMALSGNLAFDAIDRRRSGAEFAAELEEAARLFLAYACTE